MKRSLGELLESDEEVALVVQGGGMRGVYSIAAMAELYAAGYGNRFSEIIGTSAGALHGAYFLAGQPEDGVSVYTEFLSGKRFINFGRPRKVLDIDYLIDHIICGAMPLQEEPLLQSPSRLWIALSSTEGDIHWKTQHEPWPITETLRAAAAMPIAYTRPVHLGDQQYLDGGVQESLGISYALQQGYKNILVIMTRPFGYEKKQSRLEQILISFLARKAGHTPQLISHLIAPDQSISKATQLVQSPDVNVWGIAPGKSLVGRLSREKDKLRAAALQARGDVRMALNKNSHLGEASSIILL